MSYSIIDSPIGDLTVVEQGGALVGLYMTGHRPAPLPETFGQRVDDVLPEATRQLRQYFTESRTSFDLPLAPVGTDFQLRVWAALREIPYAETRSYGDLATAIGQPGAARAVGLANSRNPISIVVPCHRVVGATGRLTGYAGGIERKSYLLSLEQGTHPLFGSAAG